LVSDSEALVAGLREHSFTLGIGDDRCVPEPIVKTLLAKAGVTTPSGTIVQTGARPSDAAKSLRGPLVLKAWGPGIVHKSELGAVQVGLDAGQLDEAAAIMAEGLERHGLVGARLYVEEMAPPGTEVLFGVVSRPPFGNLALLGAGGTKAELFGKPVIRLCPLSAATAAEMVDTFPGAALLKDYRGAAPADRGALIAAMLAIAGEGGLAEQLGGAFSEFECNPLFVSACGVTAADARLILHGSERAASPATPLDLQALFRPKSVAVVGASATRATAWGNRTLARYRAMGWTNSLYAVHPTATEIGGVPAYPSLGAIPGGVDYAEVSVAAEMASSVLTAAAGTAKTATINSAGFSEVGEDGRQLEIQLVEAARLGGVRFIGPNCMGVYSPYGRQGFSGATSSDAGRVAAIMQSGGLATDLIQAGANRGMKFSAVVSVGNAADIRLSDLLGYAAQDDMTEIIGIYVEGGADERLIEIIRNLRGRKPVVLLVPGLSSIGSRIAASHTGSMTSDRRGWEALATATGATVTETFEEFLACLIYLDRYSGRDMLVDDSVLVMGLGGGASVLSADACDAQGLALPRLNDELQTRLGDKKGGILLNPLDLRMGPAGPPETARAVLDAVLPVRAFSDVMIHVNALGYTASTVPGRLPGLQHLAHMIEALQQDPLPPARIGIVMRNVADLSGPLRDELLKLAQCAKLPLFDRFSDAACAIAAMKRFSRMRARR
jgi:acyl-CoA synthetase (NDP forming)